MLLFINSILIVLNLNNLDPKLKIYKILLTILIVSNILKTQYLLLNIFRNYYIFILRRKIINIL
jgi:hypothetical protein